MTSGKGTISRPPSTPAELESSTLRRRRTGRSKRSRKRLTIELVPESFRKVTGVRHEPRNSNGENSTMIRLVELDLDGRPLGFHVERRFGEDGCGEKRWQVVISGLEPNSKVRLQGLLSEGDEVISINGKSTNEVSSQQEIALLLHVSDCLSLAVVDQMEALAAHMPALIARDSAALAPVGPNDYGSSSDSEVAQSPETPRKNSCSGQFRAVRCRSLSRDEKLNCPLAPTESRHIPEAVAAHDECSKTQTETATDTPTEKATMPLDPKEANEPEWIQILRQLSPQWTQEQIEQAGTRMLRLAQIFVPEPGDECLSLADRRALLAKCLAEEFDLPFLSEPGRKVSFTPVAANA